MALLRPLGLTVLVSALTVGGAAPAASAPAASDVEQPVSVLALTTGDGELTELADDGLEALAQPEPRTLRSTPSDQGPAPDATATAPDGVALLTAPLATDEFFVAGVTWDGEDAMPPGAAVSIRVMEAGQWQEWAELEIESSADEPGTTGGTEPYIAAGAEAVQVQINGDADSLPANIRVSLTPEWPGDEEVVVDANSTTAAVAPSGDPVAPAPAAAPLYQRQAQPAVAEPAASEPAEGSFGVMSASATPRPSIISRAGWGANESMMRWRPSYANLRAAVVHHTAGSNNYTRAQSAGIVRGIYHYHANTRGWGDIGYNFLVDKWGRIYEGRSGTLASTTGRMPVGAHAAPFNTGTVGLSVMGDYTKVGVPQASMNAMADILAWQFGRAGLDATGRSGMISPGTYARPRGQNLGRVFAHRDVSATACPGNDIYGRMGWLARAANDRMVSTPTDTISHTGTVYLNNDWGPWSDIDYAFGNADSEVYVGDWDGNGTDNLAIRRGNTFHVYGRNAAGALDSVIQYGRPGDEVLVGDWDGDGKDTFAVRRGTTFHVKNSVTGGDADHVITYGRPGDEVLVGDWDTDGQDTFAVRRGPVFHVKNSIAGGPADEVIVYGRQGDRVLVGDWDGDGIDTFAVRRGFVYHVKNRIAGGDADIVLNYGRRDDRVLVGDWDGDGTDTLGVHRP